MGPLPRFTEDEVESDKEGEALEAVHEKLLASKDIRAAQTTSQRLAEANHKWAPAETEVPEYLQDFRDVFAKESINMLPNWKVWHYAIKLKPGSQLSKWIVYLLFPNKQTKLTTGAIILQQLPEDGKWHLIVFFSKSLSPVEWNYKKC